MLIEFFNQFAIAVPWLSFAPSGRDKKTGPEGPVQV